MGIPAREKERSAPRGFGCELEGRSLTIESSPIPVVSIFVLVDVVSRALQKRRNSSDLERRGDQEVGTKREDAANSPEMLDEIKRVRVVGSVTVSVEESEGKVGAAEGGEFENGNIVVVGRESFERSDVADSKAWSLTAERERDDEGGRSAAGYNTETLN